MQLFFFFFAIHSRFVRKANWETMMKLQNLSTIDQTLMKKGTKKLGGNYEQLLKKK